MKFVNLHAHSGVGSPFDGFGYPQEHMDFAFDNGCEALALTDHGNMNGFAYQVLHAKKMKKQPTLAAFGFYKPKPRPGAN